MRPVEAAVLVDHRKRDASRARVGEALGGLHALLPRIGSAGVGRGGGERERTEGDHDHREEPRPSAPNNESMAAEQPQHSSETMRQLSRGLAHAWRELNARRGLRVGLLGAFLVILGAYLGGGSALTAPLLVAGLVLIFLGALGPRLSGRLHVEWGAHGASIDLRTEVAAPGVHPRPELPAAAPAEPKVIESSGETVEIELAELQALVDAAGGAAPEPRVTARRFS